MYIKAFALAASLTLLCSSNGGISAAPLASTHQQLPQQQPNQQIQKRAPRLPAGISVAELLAATAVGVGAGGLITSALKAINRPRKPNYDWDSGVDKGEESMVGGEMDDDIRDENHEEKFIVVNEDEAADES